MHKVPISDAMEKFRHVKKSLQKIIRTEIDPRKRVTQNVPIPAGGVIYQHQIQTLHSLLTVADMHTTQLHEYCKSVLDNELCLPVLTQVTSEASHIHVKLPELFESIRRVRVLLHDLVAAVY